MGESWSRNWSESTVVGGREPNRRFGHRNKPRGMGAYGPIGRGLWMVWPWLLCVGSGRLEASFPWLRCFFYKRGGMGDSWSRNWSDSKGRGGERRGWDFTHRQTGGAVRFFHSFGIFIRRNEHAKGAEGVGALGNGASIAGYWTRSWGRLRRLFLLGEAGVDVDTPFDAVVADDV